MFFIIKKLKKIKKNKKNIKGGNFGKSFKKFFMAFSMLALFITFRTDIMVSLIPSIWYILATTVGIAFILTIFSSLTIWYISFVLPEEIKNFIEKIADFIIGIIAIYVLYDTLVISSYNTGCLLEQYKFKTYMAFNKDFKDKWTTKSSKNTTTTAPPPAYEATPSAPPPTVPPPAYEATSSAPPQAGGNINNSNNELYEHLFSQTKENALLHKKCSNQEVYCYTDNDIEDMRKSYANTENNESQAIYNKCMKLYYDKHSLTGNLITNLRFIYENSAAKYGFMINTIILICSISLLLKK